MVIRTATAFGENADHALCPPSPSSSPTGRGDALEMPTNAVVARVFSLTFILSRWERGLLAEETAISPLLSQEGGLGWLFAPAKNVNPQRRL